MRRRVLGGFSLPEFGFGGSPLGGVFGAIDEREAIRAVHAALEHGVDYFDVAPFYGQGRAESVLGRALKGVPRDRFVLSTKVGRYGEHDFDFSARRVRTSIEESLARLGVERLDLVFAHDVEHGDPRQILEETLPALRRLSQEGRIGAVGVSGLPLAALQRFLDAAPLDVVLSYAHHHLFDVSLDGLRLGGAGLIAAAPLAMGLFTPQGPPAWHPAPASIKEACRSAVAQAAELGVDLSQVALRFALRSTRAASTLVGMCTREEVEANVRAVGGDFDAADEALLRALEPTFAPIRGATWGVTG